MRGNGINQIGVNAYLHQSAKQQGYGVPQRKQADVEGYILESMEEKNHTDQKQEIVIAGD